MKRVLWAGLHLRNKESVDEYILRTNNIPHTIPYPPNILYKAIDINFSFTFITLQYWFLLFLETDKFHLQRWLGRF